MLSTRTLMTNEIISTSVQCSLQVWDIVQKVSKCEQIYYDNKGSNSVTKIKTRIVCQYPE
mgnify:CR=1 FL=1